MMKLDAITLEFARQVIEEETGAPLEIQSASARSARARPAEGGTEERTSNGAATEARLVARDERNNPLISTFDWSHEAAQRILRVPAGFMRNKTQERIEELARERAVPAIDLALVEEGIEIGKRMMAELIATYPSQGKDPEVATQAREVDGPSAAAAPARDTTRGGGYLNEVRSR
jgi:hypothetical protein